MKLMKRLFRHGFMMPWAVKQHFPEQSLQRIETEIAKSEAQHLGEIRFVVESHLPFTDILRKKTGKKRAIEVFSQLNVWDTEHNNGVLIYLLLADHDFEILGDRGIHQKFGQAGWEDICQQMEGLFRKGQFEMGVIFGIHQITECLIKHFPTTDKSKNELSNKAVIL